MKTIEIIILVLLIVLIALIVGGLIYYIYSNKKHGEASQSMDQNNNLVLLNDRLNTLTQAINTQLTQQNQDALKNTEK